MNILTINDLLKYLQKNLSASFSIDRFEENFAVCENLSTEEMILISQNLISKEAKPGDILVLKENILIVDLEATKNQQDHVKNLVDQLFKRKSK